MSGLFGFRGTCHIKVVNWLFKHHTTPLWATCMQAVVILGHSHVTLPSVGPRGLRRRMHHFDLHQERLINFTIKEDSNTSLMTHKYMGSIVA